MSQFIFFYHRNEATFFPNPVAQSIHEHSLLGNFKYSRPLDVHICLKPTFERPSFPTSIQPSTRLLNLKKRILL